LDRIDQVNQNMMLYVFLTSQAHSDVPKPTGLIKLSADVTRLNEDTGILRLHDIDRIIWNNLGRIDALIYADIETVCTSERYDWTTGRDRSELENMGSAEWQRLFYLAAKRAGEEGHASFVQHRELAEEALAFWYDYWQRSGAARSLDEARVEQALEVLHGPHVARVATDAPWCSCLHNVPDEIALSLVGSVLGKEAPSTNEQVVDAFRLGHLAYEVLPNIMPVRLFTVRLPIVDPARTSVYLREAHRTLRAFNLGWTWYSWVENRRPPARNNLDFYDQMAQEIAGL
jgi:hypothetical protein